MPTFHDHVWSIIDEDLPRHNRILPDGPATYFLLLRADDPEIATAAEDDDIQPVNHNGHMVYPVCAKRGSQGNTDVEVATTMKAWEKAVKALEALNASDPIRY